MERLIKVQHIMSALVVKNFLLIQCPELKTAFIFIVYLLACAETLSTSDSYEAFSSSITLLPVSPACVPFRIAPSGP
jgi:hypothetical protein